MVWISQQRDQEMKDFINLTDEISVTLNSPEPSITSSDVLKLEDVPTPNPAVQINKKDEN